MFDLNWNHCSISVGTCTWTAFESADLVIGLPNSLSPYYPQVAYPPKDLFDLILVDEAHHEAAPSWAALLDHFDTSRKVLLTATPYRRDGKRLRYKGNYVFPVSAALADGEYAPVDFDPVEASEDQIDIAIARRTQDVFTRDATRGLGHRVVIRTDQINRGLELLRLYKNHTTLKLELLSSRAPLQVALEQLSRVKQGELDGVIGVNMLGEGLDLPNLKIAALHSPQKSLETTLQFIGRLSRVRAEDQTLGSATIIAAPQQLKGELRQLYNRDASWASLIPKLADMRLLREEAEREVFESFQRPAIVSSLTKDLPLDSLEPRFHCKLYFTKEDLVLTNGMVNQLGDVELNTANYGEDTLVWIGSTSRKPAWLATNHLANLNYHLYVVRYLKAIRILMVSCSLDSEFTHDQVARRLCRLEPEPVPLYVMERVLLDLEDVDPFSIGMRSNFPGVSGTAYEIRSGDRPDASLSPLDGITLHKGHLSLKATEDGTPITVGFSPSKAWSLQRGDLAEYLLWLDHIGSKLSRSEVVRTYTPLDFLTSGELILEFPENPLYLAHNAVVYRDFPQLINLETGETIRLDEALFRIDFDHCTRDSIGFHLEATGVVAALRLQLTPPYVAQAEDNKIFIVKANGYEFSIEDYLNEAPPSLYFADLSVVTGNTIVRSRIQSVALLPEELLKPFLWVDKCDIYKEEGSNSVQEAVEQLLLADSDQHIIYFDHTQGELADFISISEGDSTVVATLYHCKAHKKERGVKVPPRGQVSDIYEVDGQGAKCALSISTLDNLVGHIIRRSSAVGKARYSRGSSDEVRALAQRARRKITSFRIILVHPGLSKARASVAIRDVLGTLNELCHRRFRTSIEVHCSP